MPDGYKARNEPDPDWWMDQIKAGIDFRKEIATEARWDTWTNLYRGTWGNGSLRQNLFFSLLRHTVPRVYFRDPAVTVSPMKPGMLYAVFARLMERIDRRMFRQMRLKQQLKTMTMSAFLYGTGAGKLGFGGEYSYDRSSKRVEAPTGTRGERFEYYDHIRPNMPWFKSIHPRNQVWPAYTGTAAEARWSATVHNRAVEDVKNDPRLDKKARADVKPFTLNEITHGKRRMKVAHAVESVDIIEVSDKKMGKTIVLGPGGGKKSAVLYHGPTRTLRHGVPDVPLVFNEDPEWIWGVPDSRILEGLQKDTTEAEMQMRKHWRASAVKLAVDQNSIDPVEADKINTVNSPAVIKFKRNPNISMRELRTGDIPQALLMATNMLEQTTRETLGFGRNQAGEYRPGSEAATAMEAQIVQAASEIRMDERRDMVADILVEIVEMIHDIIFEHWTTQEIIDVVGPGGVSIWVRFTPSMLALGQYAVKIDPDNSQPETRATKEQRAISAYTLLKENPFIDPLKLTQYLLHNLHGVEFDDMMRQLPGLGNQPNGPVTPLEFGEIVQQQAANFNGSQGPRAVA